MKNKSEKFKDIFSVLSIFVLGGLSAFFLITYILISTNKAFRHEKAVTYAVIAIFSILSVASVICKYKNKKTLYRVILATLVLSALIFSFLYILKDTGVIDKFSSIESLRAYVLQKGAFAWVVMIAVQFLQVTLLPIPGIITTGASVALFGPFKGAVISFIGIYSGSVTAFFIGRKFGLKVVKYLVGKKNLEKARLLAQGKDKIMLTAMFLLPFFPDDLLCFVSGLSSMSERYFLSVVALSRLVSVFTTAYSLNGSLIPFDTEFGMSVWAILLLFTGYLSLVIYKSGDKLSEKLSKFFKKR